MSRLIPLGYMAVILIIASIPDTGETRHLLALVSHKVKNLLHIPLFGLLAVLWILALRSHGMAVRQSVFIAFMLGLLYGALTEVYQAWIPGRFPSVLDFMFDGVGILLSIWLYWKVTVTSSRFRIFSRP